MKHLFILLLLVSCGRKTVLVENNYDDSRLQAYELIQDARLDALEMSEILVAGKLSRINQTLTNIQREVSTGAVSVLPICNSNEHLIKTNTGFFAVYMVSNNFGTFLGKLDNDVLYQTTDSIRARFIINGDNINCQVN